jgi:ribosomal protein S18 acetylase RimI-like enzyme
MELRPYREADLPKLVNLWKEAHRGSHEFIPYTAGKLHERLERTASTLVALDEDEIVGLAMLTREWYGEELKLLARLGPRRGEIEERLLAAIEPQAQTSELTVVIDANDQERVGFFAARGYEPEGSLYQVVAELGPSLPSPSVPLSYVLRSLRPDEEEAFIRVVNTSYEGERLRTGVLAEWKEEHPAFSAEWVQVAEYDGRLIAVVVARTDRGFNRHYQARRGYLGPAATLPDHRGKDLGKALTIQAMGFLRRKGLTAVCLYTWSGNAPALGVARALGFRVGYEWRILTKAVVTEEE